MLVLLLRIGEMIMVEGQENWEMLKLLLSLSTDPVMVV